jgi:NTP pyrophosphatase (non-canonical NTP hydrolase)
MEIKKAQKIVDDWIKSIGVRYFSELTNMTILTEEVGELAKLMARQYGEQSFKKSEDEKHAKEYIEEEIADVLFVLICLSNQMDIDLESAFKNTINKKTNRDRLRHASNKKLK